MKKIELICPNCNYYFFPEEHQKKEKQKGLETESSKKSENVIECPYCRKKLPKNEYTNVDDIPKSKLHYESEKKLEEMWEKGILSDLTEDEKKEYKIYHGYEIALAEFKDIFEAKEKREQVIEFFNEEIKNFRVEFHEEEAKFFDTDNQEVPIEEVHEVIQNDIVMQRKIYGLKWMVFRNRVFELR